MVQKWQEAAEADREHSGQAPRGASLRAGSAAFKVIGNWPPPRARAPEGGGAPGRIQHRVIDRGHVQGTGCCRSLL